MYKNLKDKKLLVIGSDAGTANIINIARKLGVYTISADGILDRSKTPAKLAADEAWDINYSNTKEIAKLCKEANVDGVLAGYSEYRVLAACRIARELGLPFFATEEQILLTRNKRTFKDLCVNFDVPIPKDYCFSYPLTQKERDSIEFPVIVKPTDYGGRKGISICFTEEELDSAMLKAVASSESSTIIVEDYLEGIEFSSIYTVSNGKIALSSINDKYITDDQEIKTGLCECLISPSSFCDRYLNEIDKKIQNLIRDGIKAQNGCVFFQGMITADKIYVFEMGYRTNGNNDYVTIDKYNGINYMKMLISHSLTGDMADDISKNNPLFPEKTCTLVLQAHAGEIAVFEYQNLKSNPKIYDIVNQAWIGKKILEDGSTAQCVMKVRFTAQTHEELAETINFIYDNVTVKDAHGNDMLFKRFDTNKLYQK